MSNQITEPVADLKTQVRDFWQKDPCGEVYAEGNSLLERFESHRATRYSLVPEILRFGRFADAAGRDVLEIGVGMGADHVEWAKAGPRSLAGIDLTPAGIEYTRQRLQVYGFSSHLQVGDAENLPFPDESFDIVYSWGVLHHSPDTARAVREVLRVLRPQGVARIMIYHKYSIVGYMLWLRYGLLKGRPLRSLTSIYAEHLESPGTKAYSIKEATQLFQGFSSVHAHSELCIGDTLEGSAGQRHPGVLLNVVRAIWPRKLVRRFFPNQGLTLLVDAAK